MLVGAPGDNQVYVFSLAGVHEGNIGHNQPGLGSALAVDGSRLAAGAASDNKVYVFERQGSSWSFKSQISHPDTPTPGDEFGAGVGLEGSLLVVGAPGNDDTTTDAGGAYVFERQGSSWVWQYKIADLLLRLIRNSTFLWDQATTSGKPSA